MVLTLQDSDGEAGIALVGVHSEYPGKFQSEEKYSEKEGPATVGSVSPQYHSCTVGESGGSFLQIVKNEGSQL